jgi:AbrB family looped-hinge helix DNA binding protein
MAKFRAKLVKWGNSVGLSLPKPIRDNLDLQAGDEVEIVDTGDIITIQKITA